jgi:hypothetical protein
MTLSSSSRQIALAVSDINLINGTNSINKAQDTAGSAERPTSSSGTTFFVLQFIEQRDVFRGRLALIQRFVEQNFDPDRRAPRGRFTDLLTNIATNLSGSVMYDRETDGAGWRP